MLAFNELASKKFIYRLNYSFLLVSNMKRYTKVVTLSTKRRFEIIDVTNHVERVLEESKISDGFLIVTVPHTTAAITINEPDSDLFEDILDALKKIVPPQAKYRHNEKYQGIPHEQNAHAHILTSLIKPNLIVNIENKKLDLGTWQAILFVELDGPRSRRIKIKVVGE